MIALPFRDTALFYPSTADDYGQDVLGDPTEVPCMFVQTTGYAHRGSQDAITGAPRIALPADHEFVTDRAYRLEGLIVEVNPFGGSGSAQRFKVSSVTPARDLLLANQLHHVECELQKVETESYVS